MTNNAVDIAAATGGPLSRSRRVPGSARKITACVACRRLKIKCHMPNAGDPTCVRCRKRGTQCCVSKAAMKLDAGDDAIWKTAMMERLEAMDEAMRSTSRQLAAVQSQLESRRGSNSNSNSRSRSGSGSGSGLGVMSPRPSDQGGDNSSHREEEGEISMDIDSGPAIVPSSSVKNVRNDSVSSNSGGTGPSSPDLIDLGLLTMEQAQHLFHIYASRLDHYLYRILGRDATLEDIRRSSRVLAAAVCTVGALHAPELPLAFDKCYEHYRSVAAGVLFAKDASLDDIRGLCIGAFWLRDVASKLSAIAVTLVTQRNLHQCSLKNPASISLDCYEEIRLYYLVYICDHHFSIAHGRPPITPECELIHASNNFLLSPDSTEDDARIVSQVQVWSTSTQGLNLLGFDVHESVHDALIPSLRRLMISLDTWRANWNERFGHNTHVGNYPRKGVKLHYHFARLYLCSHAFRGLPSRSLHQHASISSSNSSAPLWTTSRHLNTDLEEIAEAAVDSAQSILRTIIGDGDIQSHLNGLPLYFDTMIAFAIVFLFKVATRFSVYMRIGAGGAMQLIHEVADAMRTTVARMHRQHFLVALTGALSRLLTSQQQIGSPGTLPAEASEVHHGNGELGVSNSDSATLVGGAGGEYDQPPPPGFDFVWEEADFSWDSFDFLAVGNNP